MVLMCVELKRTGQKVITASEIYYQGIHPKELVKTAKASIQITRSAAKVNTDTLMPQG
jgi:hypothetical protein